MFYKISFIVVFLLNSCEAFLSKNDVDSAKAASTSKGFENLCDSWKNLIDQHKAFHNLVDAQPAGGVVDKLKAVDAAWQRISATPDNNIKTLCDAVKDGLGANSAPTILELDTVAQDIKDAYNQVWDAHKVVCDMLSGSKGVGPGLANPTETKIMQDMAACDAAFSCVMVAEITPGAFPYVIPLHKQTVDGIYHRTWCEYMGIDPDAKPNPYLDLFNQIDETKLLPKQKKAIDLWKKKSTNEKENESIIKFLHFNIDAIKANVKTAGTDEDFKQEVEKRYAAFTTPSAGVLPPVAAHVHYPVIVPAHTGLKPVAINVPAFPIANPAPAGMLYANPYLSLLADADMTKVKAISDCPLQIEDKSIDAATDAAIKDFLKVQKDAIVFAVARPKRQQFKDAVDALPNP